MKLLTIVMSLLFALPTFAEEPNNCYISSFSYIFDGVNSHTGHVIPQKKIDQMIKLRKEAQSLAEEVSAISLTDQERLEATSSNYVRASALNAQITVLCVKIEELAN